MCKQTILAKTTALLCTHGTLTSFVKPSRAGSIVMLLAVAAFTVDTTASAATLNVVGGQLLGASGVVVEGSSYDVAFRSGTCVALFSGCNEIADFTFQSQGSATSASLALLDQVLTDSGDGQFDSVPSLTNGVAIGSTLATIETPYRFFPSGSLVETWSAWNVTVETADMEHIGLFLDVNVDLNSNLPATWAVWSATAPSPVPLPGALVLFAFGLAGIGMTQLKQRKLAA